MNRRAIRSLGLMLIALSIVLTPGVAPALLLGDEVSVTLTLLPLPGTDIFSGNVTVGAGLEVSTNFSSNPDTNTVWNLDVSDTGFVLTGTCQSDSPNCVYDAANPSLRLAITGLDFSPPAALVQLVGISEDGLNAFAGSPSVTASSVVIDFVGFQIGTGTGPDAGVSYTASFEVQSTAAVPHPATFVVVALGAGAGALALRRPRD